MGNEYSNIVTKSKIYSKVDTVMRVVNKENLIQANKLLKGNKALGIDEVTKKEYNEQLITNVTDLEKRVFKKSYKPKPVKRVYIPKAGSTDKRPLGIPSYEDKLIQLLFAKVLEAVYEPMFLDCSYGFRPNRNCHKAIAKLERYIQKENTNYILDIDIKGYFNNINQDWLVKFIEYRISDKLFIMYIKRFLKSGMIENNEYKDTNLGTPQGGIISPILANIYLHFVLDLWFEKVMKEKFIGYCDMIRYADDVIFCFQSENEAKEFLNMLIERLKKFDLELNLDKTKLIPFGRFAKRKGNTFDFLGFTHYCSSNRNNGKYRTKRKTSKKKFKAKIQVLKLWIKRNMHNKVTDTIDKLNIILRGYYNYYCITDNIESVRAFHKIITNILFSTLRRRSQKNKITYDIFYKHVFNNIIKPVIKVDIVKLSYQV